MIATFDYSEKIAGEFLQFMDQMTKTIGMLVLFGMVTGFSVIYVSLTISLSERNRELATMLVVGMSPGEVHKILLIEQFIISILGIFLGLPLGKLMLVAFAESSSTEYLVMPSEVPFNAMVFSVITTIIAIIIPQIIGRMKINKIVVTESLNARE
jgi:putative ABC transport system permease protein